MQFDFGDLESPLSGYNFINANLEPWRDALHSLHKGPSTPSYAVAGMMWIDDSGSPWVLNIFDGTDNISVGTVDPTTNTFTPSGVSQAAADISVDNSGFTVFGGDDVQEVLGEVDTFADSFGTAAFEDAGDFATAAQGALANTALQPGFSNIQDPVVKASTSGTSVEFLGTDIPSGVKKIIFNLIGVSTNGTSSLMIQLGDSGGFENTTYLGAVCGASGSSVTLTGHSTGFVLTNTGATAAGSIHHGQLILTLANPSTNTWTISGGIAQSNLVYTASCYGEKSLSAILDKVRLTTVNGTDVFDLGSVSVVCET